MALQAWLYFSSEGNPRFFKQGNRLARKLQVVCLPSGKRRILFFIQKAEIHIHRTWGSARPVGAVRQFWRCSLKNVISLAVLGSSSEVYFLEGLFTSHVLNVCCLSWQFGFVLLDGEAITVQFIFSLTFYFCSNRL